MWMVIFNAFTKLLSFFFVRVYMFFKFKSNAPQCKGHPIQKAAALPKKKTKRNKPKKERQKQTNNKNCRCIRIWEHVFQLLANGKSWNVLLHFHWAKSVTCSFASHVYIHIHYQENSTAIKNSVITVKWMLGGNRNSRCLSRVLQSWRTCSTLCFQITTRAARTALLFFFA